ncbi:MAG: endonuclease NucS [Actinobacteria bacterium]|nr:endonuclease NucS [Actinomycetota bacterium]NBY43367.1 endonuclease NucS [Micrococcales bacterium]
MRLVIADCSVDYAGRLASHLPLARRLLMLKGDGSILIHSETGSYKPLNWMNPPCNFSKQEPDEEQVAKGIQEVWRVSQVKTADILWIQIYKIHEEINHELGKDPGLIKDGVEAHLQELLADQIELIGKGSMLIRREYATTIGPVDILAKDGKGQTVAIEIKRRGEIDGVEQLTRYLELLNRDAAIAPVRGIFAAQEIKPQARTLAEDRGIECLVLDYEAMKGDSLDPDSLFW